MRPGDEIIVLDNSGSEWRVRLIEVGQDAVKGRLSGQQLAQTEPTLPLTLYQGALKAQKFEWVLQKGTELGVNCFVPTICQRSVPHNIDALAKKRERWQHIIQEAAEQSGRGLLPRLEAAMTLPEAVQYAGSNSLVLMLWAKAVGPSLKDILAEASNRAALIRVALFVGPEGGFTTPEVTLASQSGLQLVKLGPRILRAETAGLAACSAIFYQTGEWD